MTGPVFVTGAAGFIGSTLVDRLLAEGLAVVGFDNLSTGRTEFLTAAKRNANFRFIHGDVRNSDGLLEAMQGCKTVIHLAANADVRHGLTHPRRDLEQNTIATMNVLEAMRAEGARDIVFASTGSVYGDTDVFPTPEDAPMPRQTSLYAASKLAAEGFIAAYAEGFGFRAHICRFVSILGPRYSHGHVFDFCRQLRADPTVLQVLGNGTARKSYLAVDDCIDAIVTLFAHGPSAGGFCEIYNLGTEDSCRVTDSIGWICTALGVKPRLEFTGGDRGWIGDNPFILLDTKKIRRLGWKPQFTIREGVERTVAWLQANPWVFQDERRP